MPDGSAHLLLHIDDTECIDLSLIKGKYKYKLKRISGLDGFKCPHNKAKIQKTTNDDLEDELVQSESIGKPSTVSAAIQKFQDAAKANNNNEIKKYAKPSSNDDRVSPEPKGRVEILV
jgi:hypothetical protein